LIPDQYGLQEPEAGYLVKIPSPWFPKAFMVYHS